MKKKHLLLHQQFAEEQENAISETSLVKPVQDKTFSVADMQKIDQLFWYKFVLWQNPNTYTWEQTTTVTVEKAKSVQYVTIKTASQQ